MFTDSGQSSGCVDPVTDGEYGTGKWRPTNGRESTGLLLSQATHAMLPVGNQMGTKEKTDGQQGTLALMVLITLEVLGNLSLTKARYFRDSKTCAGNVIGGPQTH
jgi:hypothetical protein